jgi:hypothetical protein
MPPLLSVPEQYGDDITPNFDVFKRFATGVATTEFSLSLSLASLPAKSLWLLLAGLYTMGEVFFEVVLSTSSLGLPLTAGDDGGAMAVNFYSPSRAMLCWMECQASDEKSWQER